MKEGNNSTRRRLTVKQRATLLLIFGYLLSLIAVFLVFYFRLQNLHVQPENLSDAIKSIHYDRNLLLVGATLLYCFIAALILRELTTSQTAERWQLVASHAPIHIVFTDPDGKIQFANKAAEQITGFREQEMIGQTPRIWGGLMPASFYKKMWKSIKEKRQPFMGLVRNHRKNGEEYLADAQIAPVTDERDNLLGFVAVESDVTEQRNAQKRLTDIGNMRATFITVLTHQLRTPLNGVRWNLEELLDESMGKISVSQKRALQTTHEAVVKTIDRVHDVAEAVEIEEGELTLNRQLITLPLILREISAELQLKCELGGLKCDYVIKPAHKFPKIEADPARMRQVMRRLIENASMYTPKTGTITVTLEATDDDIHFEVADSGIGIPKADQTRIFDRFYRGSNAIKITTEGQGLGLFLVKSYIEAHGGRIWFSSKENKGTTFRFELPRHKT